MPIVKYNSYKNKIVFPERIASGVLPEFSAAVRQWVSRRPGDLLTLDFSNVTKAFANGMLGIIAVSAELRSQGNRVFVILPRLQTSREFFIETNWANLLDSEYPRFNGRHWKHFAQQFRSFEELPELVNHFISIVMNHIQMPYDIVSALEWSVNEICDNVINHSESAAGGFLQVIAYPQKHIIAFSVADAGRGILASLREGFPQLANDVEAIQEAIKAGVTRNKAFGQGNGLAGTLRIINMTGGSLEILSGRGRLLRNQDENIVYPMGEMKSYPGTCVSGQISISNEFSISQALTFGAAPYTPYNIVDAKYEMEEENAFMVRIAEERVGTGTRSAGKEMRTKVQNLINAKPGYHVIIDWKETSIIASSFADEFMGKLFVSLGKDRFEEIVKNINLDQLVAQLIAKAITERSMTS